MNLIAWLRFPVYFEKSQCMYFGTPLIMQTSTWNQNKPEPHNITTALIESLPNLSKGFSTQLSVSFRSSILFDTIPTASYLHHKVHLTVSINSTQSHSINSTANAAPNTEHGAIQSTKWQLEHTLEATESQTGHTTPKLCFARPPRS